MNAPTIPSRDGNRATLGMAAAVSIGIGGMVGAGIFSVLGVVAQAAGNAMWLAFEIGGVVALLSTYSYGWVRCFRRRRGGAFSGEGLGDGILAGGLNLFMWAGYIISLALYAPPSAAMPRRWKKPSQVCSSRWRLDRFWC
jgi:amino acid transporter